MNNNKDKNDKKDKKDFWDISKIVVTLLFTTIGGGVVGGFTALTSYQFRVQEINIKRIETVEKFMPYLVGEVNGKPITNPEIARENTIIVIASLGHEELAINLAKLNPSKASILALRSIALKSIHPDAVLAIGEIGKNAKSYLKKEASLNLKNIIDQLDKSKKADILKISQTILDELNKEQEQEYEYLKTSKTTTVTWAIVIGSDTNLAGAQDEQKRAKAQQSQNKTLVKSEIIIYERQGWYATVVKGIDQDNKDKTLGYWREKFRPSSFLIDFNDWCKKPSKDKEDEYFKCE
jgi:hypothetical protein